VYGDPGLGAVLRRVRRSRRLSQERVAELAPCAPSMVSQVETGARVLHAGLAVRLDQVYGTGTMIATLAGSGSCPRSSGCATVGEDDLVRVELPLGGGTMMVSRRAVLAALSVGTTASTLPDLRQALDKVPADEELLAHLTDSLRGLESAGHVMAPARLIDPLIGHVAVLETVRHRAPVPHLRRVCLVLAAQYSNLLSGLVRESGDLHGAATWIDRAQQWADQACWPEMVAFAHVRRSELAGTCSGDGRVAVEHAARALRVAGSHPRVRAEAAKQRAYGYALDGRPDPCHRALDQTALLLEAASAHGDEPDPIITLRSLSIPSVLAQFRGTCEVYLGGGEHAVPYLDSSQAAHRVANGRGSRHHAITGARLARAYAQAGDPDRACALALSALDSGHAPNSWTTRIELRRALVPLGRWPGREDVAEVRHRVTTLA
jgi:hypothetical protein